MLNRLAAGYLILLSSIVADQTTSSGAYGSIEGSVINAVSGQPLLGAAVEARPSTGGEPRQYSTAVVADGSFSLDRLPPGSYWLTVRLGGFVPYVYTGEANSQPAELRVEAGRSRRGVHAKLMPLGTVQGQVVDEDGAPIGGAEIRLMRYEHSEFGRILGVAASSIASMEGHYQLSVPAGKYYIRAEPPAHLSGAEGSVYRPAFFPKAVTIEQATPIDVHNGSSEIAGKIILTRHQAFLLKAHFRISASRHGDVRARLYTLPVGSSPPTRLMLAKAGTVEFGFLARGLYMIEAFAAVDQNYRARVEVSVDGDIEDLEVLLEPEKPITGTVRVEGSGPFDYTTLRISTRRMEAVAFTGGPLAIQLRDNSSVDEGRPRLDGLFRLVNRSLDRLRIVVEGLSDTYYVKSALLDGRDVWETGFSGEQGGQHLEIQLSPGAATLQGTVADGQRPAAGIHVVLVPSSKTQEGKAWFYPATVSGMQGTFALRGIRPGSYKLVAWKDIEQFAWLDSTASNSDLADGITLDILQGDNLIQNMPRRRNLWVNLPGFSKTIE